MFEPAPDLLAQSPPQVISVSELTRLARHVLERQLPLMWVAGEVSNCKRYDSGHCYFTLKDGTAQVECVLFRQKGMLVGWLPQDGMQIEVRAYPTLYEARGRFQLNVETMRRAGLGALYEAFARLKARLDAEGLFDPARKRPLPRFPRAVGIVTSPQAAALRDVLTTLKRRMPGLPAILYPAPVQGEGAGARVATAITAAGARGECDVLIVCRGGGSIEDLWAFNDEAVARAIVACAVPVVTGIGHETDFTIADFAADLRAPTPTAAAEHASPDRAVLARLVRQSALRLQRCSARGMEDRMQRLDYLSRRLTHPGEHIRRQLAELGQVARRLRAAWRLNVDDDTWRLRDLGRRFGSGARHRVEATAAAVAAVAAHLRHLNPEHVLERGYSITHAADGSIVRDSAALSVGDDVQLTFARGAADARVRRKT